MAASAGSAGSSSGSTHKIQLPILCFNDVYRVSQKYVAQPGAPEEEKVPRTSQDPDAVDKINVAQFGELLLSRREKWADRADGTKDGLVLFAGDVFNPSVESSVTRGSHMVPIMNALKIDCACIGNHDFDFGFPHLTKLLESTTFPWLLSNIVDESTGTTPEPLRRFWVTERCGLRIGVIGLVEQDWIATIPSWPDNFTYRDMAETARTLSKELRDPAGEHRVDMIIALTHCRVPNVSFASGKLDPQADGEDIKLCNELGATSEGRADEHGVDLVIGGHDHMYYIGKGGSDNWTGFSGDHDAKGTEADTACHLIKSGTDFRDLTAATLTLSPPSPSSSSPSSSASVRRKIVSNLTGEHLYVIPSSPTSAAFEHLIEKLLSSVSDALSKPVCFALTPFDARSELVRTRETGLGNWVADVLLHAYAESGVEGGKDFFEKDQSGGEGGRETAGDHAKENGDRLNVNGNQAEGESETREQEEDGPKTIYTAKKLEGLGDHGADAVLLCGGTLRGDSQYGPGKITLGDILEILPFEDPVVCLEIDGKGIWDVLEVALSKWPAQEGRFPIVAGLAVTWDHALPPLSRIKSIHLYKHPVDADDGEEIDSPEDLVRFVEQDDGTRVEVNQRRVELGEEVKRDESRVYRVITREYMAQGYDGFEGLKNRKFIVDDENGQIMSSIIRSFLLGSAYIFRHKQLMEAHDTHLSSRTDKVISRARQVHHSPASSLSSSPTSTRGGQHGWGGRAQSHPASSPLAPHADLQDSVASLPASGAEGWGSVRRHVVKHDWRSIRDALWVGRNEHMSAVDDCKGDELRSHMSNGDGDGGAPILKPSVADKISTPKPIPTSDKGTQAVLINHGTEDELKRLGAELAIVCPLVDGRMRDLSEGK